MWLDFIIKTIKTEPCPYVYIWSRVTVRPVDGQRGTGNDYVLAFYPPSKTVLWNKVDDAKEALEELAKNSS